MLSWNNQNRLPSDSFRIPKHETPADEIDLIKPVIFSNDMLFQYALRALLADIPGAVQEAIFFDLTALPDIREINISGIRCAVFFSTLPLEGMLDRYFSFPFLTHVINRRMPVGPLRQQINQLVIDIYQCDDLTVTEKKRNTNYHRKIIRGLFSPRMSGGEGHGINKKQLSAHKQKFLKLLSVRGLAELYVPMRNLYALEKKWGG